MAMGHNSICRVDGQLSFCDNGTTIGTVTMAAPPPPPPQEDPRKHELYTRAKQQLKADEAEAMKHLPASSLEERILKIAAEDVSRENAEKSKARVLGAWFTSRG